MRVYRVLVMNGDFGDKRYCWVRSKKEVDKVMSDAREGRESVIALVEEMDIELTSSSVLGILNAYAVDVAG